MVWNGGMWGYGMKGRGMGEYGMRGHRLKGRGSVHEARKMMRCGMCGVE